MINAFNVWLNKKVFVGCKLKGNVYFHISNIIKFHRDTVNIKSHMKTFLIVPEILIGLLQIANKLRKTIVDLWKQYTFELSWVDEANASNNNHHCWMYRFIRCMHRKWNTITPSGMLIIFSDKAIFYKRIYSEMIWCNTSFAFKA